MKNFWVIMLAALLIANNGSALVWANDMQPESTAEKIADQVDPVTEDAVVEDEGVTPAVVKAEEKAEEKAVAAAEVADDATSDDEFSDSLAMEGDKADAALNSVATDAQNTAEKVL